jgi:anti-anti-sigma factor
MIEPPSGLEVAPDGANRYVVTVPPEYGRQRRHTQLDGGSASLDIVSAIERAVAGNGGTLPQGISGGIILDLAHVDFMNSSAIGSVFSLRKFVRANAARIVVCRPSPAIRRLLDTVNLPSLVPVTRSLDEARTKLDQLNEALGEMERLESSARQAPRDEE